MPTRGGEGLAHLLPYILMWPLYSFKQSGRTWGEKQTRSIRRRARTKNPGVSGAQVV